MRCLSLWQPWATLLAAGKKMVETRGRPMRHRGPLLIHAAKKWDGGLSGLCVREPFKDALESLGVFHVNPFLRPALPFGAIVGSVTVLDCLPTERVGRWEQTPGDAVRNYFLDNLGVMGPGDGKPFLFVSDVEREFGDYSPGRFAILCRDFVAFRWPIPCRGARELFDVPDAVVAAATTGTAAGQGE